MNFGYTKVRPYLALYIMVSDSVPVTWRKKP